MVVVDGADRLREGAKVEVVTRDAPAPAAPEAARNGQSAATRTAARASPGRRAPPRAKDWRLPRAPTRRSAMNPSRLFILRPVATSLLMVAILLVGIVAYRVLPLSALPKFDYPTIQVVTLYPGASPSVITSSITAPLERQFGQMPGLNQMSSASSGGASVITLQFSLELPLDVAEQEVQAAINAAGTFLPADLPQPPIYNKVNPADTPIVTLARHVAHDAAARDPVSRRHAARDQDLPAAGRRARQHQRRAAPGGAHPGQSEGARRVQPVARRSAHRDRQRQLEPGEGQLRRPDARVDDRRQRPASLGRRIQVDDRRLPQRRAGAPRPTSPTSIDGAENTRLAAWANESAAVIVNIQRQPGANVIEVVDRIKRLLPQLSASLPAAVDVAMLTDRTVTIRASVRDVQFELMLAVALVVMIIFLFLRNVAATVIPSVAVPLSLVGTFAVMYLAGFSINNLTLMALTIATGFVVDDAIVMIENISRYIEKGESPLDAALKGAEQIGFTIISLTVSLIAVLIPLLFMGDVVGRLFREFAITLAVAILLSAVVSLTLTPMMCARLLRHVPVAEQGRFFRQERRVVRPRDRALRAHADVGARPPGRDAARGDRHARCSPSCSTSRFRRASSPSRTPARSRASRRPRRRSPSPRWPIASRRWRR